MNNENEQSERLHKPTPWGFDHHDTPFYNDAYGQSFGGDSTDLYYIYADGSVLADGLTKANAEFIVTACNEHYQLKEQVRVLWRLRNEAH